jgi:hypothetical protein
MNEPRPNYVRLPGRGKTLAFSMFSSETQRLYMSNDHLLVVRDSRSEETHKKFYYNDIQAITVQSNSDFIVMLVFHLVLLAIIFGLGILAVVSTLGDSLGVYVVFGLLAVIPFIYFVKNLIQGKTCSVRLHTAVQVQELTALRRISVARSSLDLLKTHIESAQGRWQEDQPSAISSESPAIQATANVTKQAMTKEVKTLTATIHRLAYGGVLVIGTALLADVVFTHWLKDTIEAVFLLVVIGLLFTAVIRQHNSTLSDRIKTWTWVTLLGVGFGFMMAFYLETFITMFDSGLEDPPGPFEIQDMSSAANTPWHKAMSAFLGIVYIFLGAVGLLHLRGYTIVENPASTSEQMTNVIETR